MGISDSSKNNFHNPGVQKPVSIARVTVPPTSTAAPLNQIRATAAKGSTGAGIPKHVTDVSASIANASTGSTSTITVTFHRDPSDTSFSKANVYVRGYQGNQSLSQIGSGSESPITFTLSNTGEPVNVLVQASGNAGDAPISTAPSRGIKLPLSAAGGYGTSTVVSPPTQLVGDVKTSGTASPLTATVKGIQGTAVSSAAPNISDTLRFNEYGDGAWDVVIGIPRFIQVVSDGGSVPFAIGNNSTGPVTLGTRSVFNATATEFNANTFTSAATASTNDVVCVEQGFGASQGSFTYGTMRRYATRLRMNNTANVRYWIGLSGISPQFGTAAYSTDAPNLKYAMFRYSAGTDATIKAVCGVSKRLADRREYRRLRRHDEQSTFRDHQHRKQLQIPDQWRPRRYDFDDDAGRG